MVCSFVKPYIIPFHRNGCHSFNNKTKRMIDLKKYLFNLTWYDTDYESKYIWQTENLPTHKEDFCL